MGVLANHDGNGSENVVKLNKRFNEHNNSSGRVL